MVTNLAFNNSISEEPCLYREDVYDINKLDNRDEFKGIIGRCSRIYEVFRIVQKVADSDSTIIINGETGTGKGLIAKAIHQSSYRKGKPFVQINCGAIPENLLESELFGHVKGAFTGATTSRPGKFEVAEGGTIFLDEIGDMSPELQVKLLRVLEEREFERVGGSNTINVDVRVIAATHRDLETEVKKGNFREDLFYRLYVIPITVPPLRERKSDISLLVSHFMKCFSKNKNKDVAEISDAAMAIMMGYSWPGNVRELKNLVERLVVLKGQGKIISCDLPEKIKGEAVCGKMPGMEISKEGVCFNTAVSEFEKSLIFQSLEKTKWVKNEAAKLLHLKRTTLVEKIKRYDLQNCST